MKRMIVASTGIISFVGTANDDGLIRKKGTSRTHVTTQVHSEYAVGKPEVGKRATRSHTHDACRAMLPIRQR